MYTFTVTVYLNILCNTEMANKMDVKVANG